ncbi:glycosyltransferase [Chloroflexota bacterium]
MEIWTDVLAWVYTLSALTLAVYATGIMLLFIIWWRHRHPPSPQHSKPTVEWPSVLVQLPVYNERAVVRRLLAAVAVLDYPRDRLLIQVLDDSNDDTGDLIAQEVDRYAASGLKIAHICRTTRTGYKAGALANGLTHTKTELVAIFDADFVPAPDFLKQVVPYFSSDQKLGMVQTRWGHLNSRAGLLTQAQALSLDGHFIVEQTARSAGGLLLNFSGSGGIWRTACIHDAGGWSAETLAEDLDLSYRAQLRGWRFRYLPQVVVPAEIPPQLAAYRQQQSRWAKGSTQNLFKHGKALWRSDHWGIYPKFMGTLHLGQYLVHPLMLVLLLLTPLLLLTGIPAKLPLAPLGLIGIGPPLVYLFSQRHVYTDWKRRLLVFPILLGVGTGFALNNTLAIGAALRGSPNVFHRTPKFKGQSWQRSRYALPVGWPVLGEALLAVYAAWGGTVALQTTPSLAPFLFIYAYAFGLVALWSLVEGVMLYRIKTRQSTVRKHLSI